MLVMVYVMLTKWNGTNSIAVHLFNVIFDAMWLLIHNTQLNSIRLKSMKSIYSTVQKLGENGAGLTQEARTYVASRLL